MYIGNDLQVAYPSYKIIDDISSSFNGSTTSFALQVGGSTPVPFPINTQQVMISVNGIIQEPDPTGSAGFKLLGSNIVFSSAPANGHAFFGVILAGADYVTAGSEFPDGSVTSPSFTFESDTDTGWYRIGSGDVGFSSNGVLKVNFDGNGINVTGTVIDDGATHDGDVTFKGASSDGLWDKSANQFVANLSGTASVATAITVADESTDTTCFPLFATAATGNLGAKSGSNLTFNSNTGALTATSFVGGLTGDVTGNCSGTAATVTGAAQTAITSVGALTSLASGNITLTGATDADGLLKIKPNGSGTMARVQLTKGDDSAFAELAAHWGSGNLFVQSGTGGFIEYRAQGTTTHRFKVNSTLVSTIESDGVHDTKGNLRSIPSNAQGGAYVGVAADAGKAIYISTGGVTINNSVHSAGDAITIINNSGSDQTITQGTGVTIYNTADAATGNRTLAGRGMATVWFASASVAYISGAGLS